MGVGRVRPPLHGAGRRGGHHRVGTGRGKGRLMSAERNTVDRLQERLVDYAMAFDYGMLPPDAAHAATVRVIDTLAALAGGFEGEPCQIARRMATRVADAG